jgi:apolipoprotein N-acyltransferase
LKANEANPKPLKPFYAALLPVTSGVLLALSFSFPSIGIFAWIGIVPLLFALKRVSGKPAFIYGVLFGFTFFATTIYWIQVFGYVAWLFLSLIHI